jgi:hypothetical protein
MADIRQVATAFAQGARMAVSAWTAAESCRAQELWSEYQRNHDLSGHEGQTVGIDPASGSLWLGDSIQDVIAQRDAAGNDAPLYFVRVGSETYYRKARAVPAVAE